MNWMKNIYDKVKVPTNPNAPGSPGGSLNTSGPTTPRKEGEGHGHRRTPSLSGSVGPPKAPTQVNANKLKIFWLEFASSKTEKEKIMRLNRIIPLFNMFVEQAKPDLDVLNDVFSNLKTFLFVLARRFVKETQSVWLSNQSRESNAVAVLKVIAQKGEGGGFELLQAIETIVLMNISLEGIADTALPSTVVIIVQLFLALPPGSDQPTAERLLKLLSQMCHDASVVQDLIKTDALYTIFSMATVDCPPQNQYIRERLISISSVIVKLHTSQTLITYLSQKNWLQNLLPRLALFSSFPPEILVVVSSNMIKALRESSSHSIVLLEDFRKADGYKFLSKLLVYLGEQEAFKVQLDKMFDVITDLVYVGTEELPIQITSPYNLELPISHDDTGAAVKSIEAFQVLQSYFLESKNDSARQKVLDRILAIYAAHTRNFMTLQPLRTLSHFIEQFESLSVELKDSVLRILSFVATVTNFVPFQELSSLSCLLAENPSSQTLSMIYQTVAKLVAFDSRYKHIFREVGLLDMLINLLQHAYDKHSKTEATELDAESATLCFLSLECLQLLVEEREENATIVRERNCLKYILWLIGFPKTRPQALQLLLCMIKQDADQRNNDMAALIEMLQSSSKKELMLKKEILDAIRRFFVANKKTTDSFREAGGFVSVVSLLVSLEASFGTEDATSEKEKLTLIETIFRTVTAAISSHTVNRKFFREQIGHVTLSSALKLTGILPTRHAFKILECLLDLATENVSFHDDSDKLHIYNPDGIIVVLDLQLATPIEVQLDIIRRVNNLLANWHNREILSQMETVGFVLKNYSTQILDTQNPLHPELLRFIETMGTYFIMAPDLRTYFKLFKQKPPLAMYKTLTTMAKTGKFPPFIEFDLTKTGQASMTIPSLGSRAWPPANGYSVSWWMYVDSFGGDDETFDLFGFAGEDKLVASKLYISNRRLNLQSSPKNVTEFSSYPFEERKWYHVVFTHTRHRFQHSEAKLYINGLMMWSGKVSYPGNMNGSTSLIIGTYSIDGSSSVMWKLGPFYLLEEALAPTAVQSIHNLGYLYSANFQADFSQYQTYEIINCTSLSANESDVVSWGLLDLSSPTANFTISQEHIVVSLNAMNKRIVSYVRKDDPSATASQAWFIPNGADLAATSGALVIGDATPFVPFTISKVIRQVGGMAVMYYLIEQAESTSVLQLVLEALVAVIRENYRNTRDMEVTKGYEIVAQFLRKKASLITSEMVDVILQLVGAAEDPRENVIANPLAFKHFILYYEIWKNTSSQLQQKVLVFVNNLLISNLQVKFNLTRMRRLNIIHNLLFLLQDEDLPLELFPLVADILYHVLESRFGEDDIHILSNFLVMTLSSESKPRIRRSQKEDVPRLQTIRIMVLERMLLLIVASEDKSLFLKFITLNWLFHFISSEVDALTATIATKILGALYMTKSNFSTKFNAANGFKHLAQILPVFWSCIELYHTLFCLFLGEPLDIIPHHLSLDIMESFVTFKQAHEHRILAVDALSVVFAMLKSSQEYSEDKIGRFKSKYEDDHQSDAVKIQGAVLQFLGYLFAHSADFQEACRSKTDLLENLVAMVFYVPEINEINSEANVKVNETQVLVYDFLCKIVEVSLKTHAKGFVLLENIIEVAPYADDDAQFIAFQTKVLIDLIYSFESNLAKKDFLENSKLVSNIAKFCSLVVDKAYQGMLSNNPRLLFEFMVRLLEKLDDEAIFKTNRADIKDIHKSLNRIILLIIGQATENKQDIIYMSANVIYHQRFIFGENNTDPDFFYSIAHLLAPAFVEENQELRENAMNVWKLLLITKANLMDPLIVYKGSKGEVIDLKTNGFDLLLQKEYSAFSAWVGENSKGALQNTFDNIKRTWTSYRASEDKYKADQLKGLKSRREQREQKARKREKHDYIKWQKIEAIIQNNVNAVQELETSRYKKYRQDELDRQRFIESQWEYLRKRLVRERGFTNDLGSPLDKWKLDSTEGPYRMRKKLQKNSNFYNDYPYVDPESYDENSPRVPTSFDSKEYMLLHAAPPATPTLSANNNNTTTTPTATPEERSGTQTVDIMSPQQSPLVSPTPSPSISPPASPKTANTPSLKEISASDTEDESESEDSSKLEEEFETEQPSFEKDKEEEEDQKIQRLLEPGDNMLSVYNCGRVEGMDKHVGLFLLCQNNVYVIDNYMISVLGDIIEVDKGKEKYQEELRRWAYEDIREILKRRHLLRPVAVEIFSNDGRSCLVAFENLNDREEVYRNLLAHVSAGSGSVEDLVGLQAIAEASEPSALTAALPKKLANLPSGLGSIATNLGSFRKTGTSTLTEKWSRGELSNFQYLMHLNTLAGRTYNDLTQYPVFPWVLCDYESEELDLNNPQVYRDLSKPMGALSKRRAEEFKIRFDNWVDPEGVIPSFHYGSHYSSAATVLYYLIRLEPFTKQAINLQGGKFDKSDRIFHSVKQTWLSASDGNTTEVMELVPEFYYLPEFLINSNRFDFGKKQTGAQIDDVALPPWAKGDPRLFIKKMRQALESDFVSEHLHEWIDLIFGYKQQGKAAEEALNVFYYLTYEGAVDLDSITDETARNATIAQINNFGQTPTQIFKKPHPKRQVNPIGRTVYSHPSSLVPFSLKDKGEAVGQIRLSGEKLLVVGLNKTMLAPNFNKYIAWGYPDFCVRIFSGDKLVSIVENLHDGHITAMASTETGKILVTGGSDSVVNVYRVRKSNNIRRFALAQTLCGHLGPISCVAVSRAYSIIVSGSSDKTCIVWDLNRLNYVRQLSMHDGPILEVAISDTTGDLVTCTSTTVNVWSVNGDLIATKKIAAESDAITCMVLSRGPDWMDTNVIATGHKDGSIKLWSCFIPSSKQAEPEKEESEHKEKPAAPKISFELVLRAQLLSHSKPITHVYIPKNDQRRMYSGDEQGQVNEWKFPSVSNSGYFGNSNE